MQVQVQSINNTNFGAFRISHSPEMRVTKQVLKKNCPDYYNNLVNSCETVLKGTRYFDGLLDVEYGQLVMRLLHSKNFVWPESSVSFDKTNFFPRLFITSKEIEFQTWDDGMLRFKKLDENERVVKYTVKDYHGCGEWSDKATLRQAELIKMLDDNMQKLDN